MTTLPLAILLVSVSAAGVETAREPSQPSSLDGLPLTFVADPLFGMESGVRSLGSVYRLSFLYDEPLRQRLFFKEDRALTQAGGILSRVVKLTLIDYPLAFFQNTLLHEVYGHGARGREAGLRPRYELDLPFPYSILSGRTGATGFAHDTYSGNLDRDIITTAGGIEVEQLSLNWVNLDVVQRSGRIHYSEQLKYILSKLTYRYSLAANLSQMTEEDLGDPAAYFYELQQRFNLWTPTELSMVATRLQRAYFFTYLDPTFWLSAYHFFVTYLYKGERYAELPSFKLLGWNLFPGTRFNLSPFGAEHYLDIFAGRDGTVIDVYFRAGSTGLAANIGLGARALGFRVTEALTLGGELDAWYQPEILFEYPGVFNPPQRAGIGGGAYADLKLFGQVGITGKLAYKSRGYVMGQPTSEGLYGYLGLSVAQTAAGALVGPKPLD